MTGERSGAPVRAGRVRKPASPHVTPDDRRRHGGAALGVLALAALAPIWGYSWVVSKVALADASPLTYVALTALLSAACLFAVMIATGRRLRPPPLRWTIPVGLWQTTLFSGLATGALAGGGAAEVTVLAYTMPLWLIVLARVVLRERPSTWQWLAVAVAGPGLLLVVRPWNAGAWSGVMACASGLAWAIGATTLKLMARRTSFDALALTSWQLFFGAVPLVALAWLTHAGWPMWSVSFGLCLTYSVVVANAVAWTLWVFALRARAFRKAAPGTTAFAVRPTG
jgi:drug/metabolite transporter (DMT)-like permease